ncbi:MAG: cupin domain-containing protein [Pseudomonadota bacterium]
MDTSRPLALLGGLTPRQFMRHHWQKQPLLVRQAIPEFKPLMDRPALFELAAREAVESRLILREAKGWRMKSGPFKARSLPPLSKPGWSLLVQGVDLHDSRAHALLQGFRFVPDARMDDLMISYASEGGGVGPHFDSYDVFLFQASGKRRWRIGQQQDLTLQEGVPLKILKNFQPTEEFVLEAGDMLYLPPRYAHDGIAEASTGSDGKPQACMTYSIGFRAPAQSEIAGALLQRLAEYCGQDDDAQEAAEGPRGQASPVLRQKMYGDRSQQATQNPAAVPDGLTRFARQALDAALKDPLALPCALGEYLTEPKPSVWFDSPAGHWHPGSSQGVRLARQTRMMYDEHHVFINGESYLAKGRDARLMQQLADERGLASPQLAKASASALDLLADWHDAGWLVGEEDD